jgi:rubredoxin
MTTYCPDCGAEEGSNHNIDCLFLLINPRQAELLLYKINKPTQTTYIPQGWMCPVCKAVYSPTTSECWKCSAASLLRGPTC